MLSFNCKTLIGQCIVIEHLSNPLGRLAMAADVMRQSQKSLSLLYTPFSVFLTPPDYPDDGPADRATARPVSTRTTRSLPARGLPARACPPDDTARHEAREPARSQPAKPESIFTIAFAFL